MLNWVNLPNPKIPLVFHGVVGDDQREAKSPSYFNPEECAMVVSYVQDLLEQHKGTGKKILPKEIGIISPYRRQVQKIRMLLEKKKIKDSKDITVGSTEEFQGQERRIIIISTVRSKPTLLQSGICTENILYLPPWLSTYMHAKKSAIDLLPDLLKDYNPSYKFIRVLGSRLRGSGGRWELKIEFP